MAKANPFRFSTQFVDDETGLSYYGYRYYDPSTGRWLNRDIITENGGANLYVAYLNDGLQKIDKLGLHSDVDVGLPTPGGSSFMSDPSAAMVLHYFFEDGNPFDLVGQGLEFHMRAMFRKDLERVKQIAKTAAVSAARKYCSANPSGFTTLEVSDTLFPYGKNVTWSSLFPIGRTRVTRSYALTVKVDCCLCKADYSGRAFISINDFFRDPLDVGQLVQGIGNAVGSDILSAFPDLEFRAGSPYSIHGTISDPVTGTTGPCKR